MVKLTKIIIIIGLIAISLSYLTSSPTETDERVVTKVVDGDTAKLKSYDENIRFLGVDTPEMDGEHYPEEYVGIENDSCLVKWAEKASNYTRKSLEDREVTLVFDSEAGEKGDYGRYLAYIELSGQDFTKDLLEKGYARVYEEADFKRKKEYVEAEEKARIQDKGLWSCS